LWQLMSPLESLVPLIMETCGSHLELQSGPVRAGPLFCARGTQSTYSKYDISATLKFSCEIFSLTVKSLRDIRCILLSCTSNALL
jgi:hypothetical protein